MTLKDSLIGAALAALAIVAASCATGTAVDDGSGGGSGGSGAGSDGGHSSCTTCDQDGDGVSDATDECPNTAAGAKVNAVGCADAQLTPKLEPTFPSYGLTWAPSGDLGRPGGLTWTYTGINRGDLFHIYWIVCDDPTTPCGLSLDGPIDPAAEGWKLSAPDSDLTKGKVVFTSATDVLLADAGKPAVTSRLTLTLTDASNAPIPFADVATLGVPARSGKIGAEITGTGFKVVSLIEVKDAAAPTWTPYLDYYDAAGTPNTGDAGGNATVSFGASFYDK